MLRFTDAGNIQHTPVQKYGVAGEDVHWLQWQRKCSQPISPMLTLASFCVVFSHENG